MAIRKTLSSSVKFGTVATLTVSLLTGCNPPMPPEALAALAEAYFTCEAGEVTSAFSPDVADGSEYLAENLAINCPGMVMSITDAANAQLVASSISTDGPGTAPYAVVPYAVESGVFVITSSMGASAVFSPKTVQGILDGSITDWADPAIVADNSGTAPLAGEITLIAKAQSEAVEALKVWYQHYTGKSLRSNFEVAGEVTIADYQDLPEGSIAFMPGGVFTQLANVAMVTPMAASLLVDPEKFPAGAVPDYLSIQSGSSQWAITKSATGISVAMNFAAKALPPVGFDEAPAPYQIIYPVNISLFGTDNLAARAVARYLLRQDSQGSLTLVAGLPVTVRAESLAFVSKGLPEPEDTDAPAN